MIQGKMIKPYVLIICSSALLIGKSILINDVYYYSDPTGISLHRPEMDHSETLILAEHDPTTNDGSFDFREIVFYIHADPSKNQKYIRKSSKSKKKRKTKKKAKPYFSQYGHWSAVHDSMFSYIQVKDDEWVGREFNLVETVITGLKKDGEILKKEERLINQEDIYFTPQLIKYFHSISTSPENDDKYYIIYINNDGNEVVLSSEDIFNSNSNLVYDIYSQTDQIGNILNPLLKDPVDIQINAGNRNYKDAVMTIYGGEETEKDIYYFCAVEDIIDETAIPLLSRSSALFRYNQYAPMFSFDGSYISYITQTNNEFELNVVQRPKYNSAGDCVENEEPDNNSFSRSKHEKVDNIMTYEDLGIDSFRFTSYAWHPEVNILFYVTNVNSEDIIRYYNADSQKSGVIDTGTLSNRYISVSPQGNYLLFTFSGYKDNSFHFINCKNKGDNTNVNCCGNKSTGHKIGVAKLEIQ